MERLTYRGSKRMTEDGLTTPSYSDYPTRRIIERLAEYEDLEEQGLLLRLPVKAGDTVYAIDGKNTQTLKARNDIALINGRLCIFAENCHYADYICYDDLGKTVFLTQEEAEQKLSEIEEKEEENCPER